MLAKSGRSSAFQQFEHLVFSLLAFSIPCLFTQSVSGAVITYNVSFTAQNFQIGSGLNPPPVSPVMGNFTVSLDPAVHTVASTSNITLNSLNIALGSPLSFTYNPIIEGGFSAGTLRVGGSQLGPDTIRFSPSSNDFWLFVPGFATTPTFGQLGYTQTSVSNNNLYFTLNQSGSVSVSAVPEPSTAGLMLFALAIPFLTCRRYR